MDVRDELHQLGFQRVGAMTPVEGGRICKAVIDLEFSGVSQTIFMVILRPTRKLSSLLPGGTVAGLSSDTALGDWYVNRVVVDRQPLLLLVSSASLLPMLLPARDVRGLPDRLAALVEARLQRCGIDARAIAAETRAMAPVAIGPTIDRSVIGIMVDFAKAVPYHLEPGQWDEDTLLLVEARLAETPCHAARSADRVIFPEKKTPDLLRSKWLAAASKNEQGDLTPNQIRTLGRLVREEFK